MSLKKVFHTAIRVSSWSHAVAIGSIALILSACTDYVDKYEGDYKETIGNEEVFRANLDKMDWDWAATCETGDWLWCAIKDGEYMNEAVTGAKWQQFTSGDVKLEYVGKDGRAYDFATDLLPEDLASLIRLNGGVAFKIEKAAGNIEAGVQMIVGNDIIAANDHIVVAYGNEYSGAKLCLRTIDESGIVRSEWCLTLDKGDVAVNSFSYGDFAHVTGENTRGKFIKEANAVAVMLTKNDETVTKGLNIVALGFGGEPYGQTVNSSSSTPKSSSSVKGGTSSSSVKTVSSSSGISWACKGTPSADAIQWEYSYTGGNTQDLLTAKFNWTFTGGDKTSSTDKRPFVLYSKNGEYTATLKITYSGTTTTITCSPARVTAHATLSSSSSVTSSSSAGGFLWKGSDKSDFVKTGYGTGGKWFSILDTEEGGSTTIITPTINPYDTCNGLCGVVKFGRGASSAWAQKAFKLDENSATYDVSSWEGLCIAYASDYDALLMLLPADEAVYGYDVPDVRVSSPAAGTQYRVANFKWSEFNQEGWGTGEKITGEEMAKALKGVAVHFFGSAGDKQFFNIYQIGSYGRCNVPPDTVVAKDIGEAYFNDRLYSSADDFLNPKMDYDSIQDPRDGKWYKTVVVSGYTWMAQNMNYESSGSYCYGDDEANCDKYGRLYTWDAAMDACPDGWRLPSKADWDSIWGPYIDNGGLTLRSSVGWQLDESSNARNTLGFSAAPGGLRFADAEFAFEGVEAKFWTSTNSQIEDYAYAVVIRYDNNAALWNYDPYATGMSVRCIKTEFFVDSTGCESTDLWCKNTSRNNNYRVNTGVDVGGETSGYWWDTYDDADGGQSTITWPAARGNQYNADVLDTIIDYCKGLCGTVTLEKGTMEYDPYVMVGFSIAGKPDESVDNVTADVSDWAGVCITYTTDIAASMELHPDSAMEREYLGYAVPYVTLPKQTSANERCFEWSNFAPPSWAGNGGKFVISGEEAAKHVKDLTVKFQGKTGEIGNFNIIRLRKWIGNGTAILSNWNYLNPDVNYGMMQDDRDGQVYKTIDVGNYTWFAQNLNLEYNDGEGNSCPGSDPDSCAKYGRMYTWAAAMDTAGVYSTQALECGAGKVCWLIDPVQGVCPEGWHLPSNAEWRLLVEAAGGESTAAVALKSTKGWVWNSSNTSGTDDLGFSAIPNGPGEYGYFWSGTENSNISGYRLRLMGDATPSTHLGDGTKSTAMNAVRCVKEMNPKPRSGSFTYQGQTYNYVRIGTQTWMAENLNYDIGNNMCYKNDPANCTAYGRMYKWATVVGKTEAECGYGNSCDLPSTGHVQGICPEGWHVPRRAEVEALVEAAGGDDFAGKALKATSTWSDYENNGKVYGNGTDATGFTGYSTGTCSGSSSEPYCNYDGMYTHMWTITENYSGEQAYYFGLLWMGNGVTLLNGDKRDYKNLRCVQDED